MWKLVIIKYKHPYANLQSLTEIKTRSKAFRNCFWCASFPYIPPNGDVIGGVTRLDGARDKKQVWRPISNLRSFGSKCTVLKKVLVAL